MPPVGRLIWPASSLTSIGWLSSRLHVVEGGRKGGLFHLGAADIFTLMLILQFKANKLKEQICTSALEFQTLSKAHTDTEQICT